MGQLVPEMDGKTFGSCYWSELQDFSCAMDSSCTFPAVLEEAFVVFFGQGILGLCTLGWQVTSKQIQQINKF